MLSKHKNRNITEILLPEQKNYVEITKQLKGNYLMGYEYEEQDKTEPAIYAYINAYCLNQNLGEEKVEEDSYDRLLHLYAEGNYKEEVIDFDEWFEEKKI